MNTDLPNPTQTSVSESSVIAQLDRICKCEVFKTKPLLCKFLSYIVSEALAGEENKIKGYSIAVDVFGKGKDFNSDQNALVRIHAGRLRRILKEYYNTTGKQDKIIIEIPKGQYAPNFMLNPLFSSDNQESRKTTKPDYTLTNASLAVCPFRNQTGEASNDYLTFGFAEELSVELTKYEDLLVYNCIPGSYSLYNQVDINTFIENKDINFALDGSIYHNGQYIIVIAKLCDIKSGKQIWAQRYKKEFNSVDLIEAKENIAQSIANSIGSEFGIIISKISKSQAAKPKSIDVFSALLKFYHYNAVLTHETGEEAFRALSQALKREPNSGIVMACLGIMHSDSYVFDVPIVPNSYELFGELAENAFILEPNSNLVNAVLAVKHFIHSEKQRFEFQFDKCLEIESEASLKTGTLAWHCMLYGGWERGKKILDKVIHASFKYPSYFHVANLLYHYRKQEYALALKETYKMKIPELFWSPMLKIAVLGQLSRFDEAKVEIDKLLQLKPDFQGKAGYLISRFVKESELVNKILEGIKLAGMQV